MTIALAMSIKRPSRATACPATGRHGANGTEPVVRFDRLHLVAVIHLCRAEEESVDLGPEISAEHEEAPDQ